MRKQEETLNDSAASKERLNFKRVCVVAVLSGEVWSAGKEKEGRPSHPHSPAVQC